MGTVMAQDFGDAVVPPATRAVEQLAEGGSGEPDTVLEVVLVCLTSRLLPVGGGEVEDGGQFGARSFGHGMTSSKVVSGPWGVGAPPGATSNLLLCVDYPPPS